jgi:hypothetical protein
MAKSWVPSVEPESTTTTSSTTPTRDAKHLGRFSTSLWAMMTALSTGAKVVGNWGFCGKPLDLLEGPMA